MGQHRVGVEPPPGMAHPLRAERGDSQVARHPPLRRDERLDGVLQRSMRQPVHDQADPANLDCRHVLICRPALCRTPSPLAHRVRYDRRRPPRLS